MLCTLTNMIDQKSKIAFYSSESEEKASQLVLEGIDIYSAVDEVEVSTSAGVVACIIGLPPLPLCENLQATGFNGNISRKLHRN